MARPRSVEARHKVIEATIETLLAEGVEGTTLEEVAARSGVAKSTIYRHFGSREALLVESVGSCITPIPTPDTGSLSDDLHEVFHGYDADDNQRINQLFPLVLDAARRDPSMRETVDALLAERQRPLRTVIQLAQLRGEVDPALDLDVALAMLVGPFTYRRMVLDDEITEEFLDIVVRGGVAALRSTADLRTVDAVSSPR